MIRAIIIAGSGNSKTTMLTKLIVAQLRNKMQKECYVNAMLLDFLLASDGEPTVMQSTLVPPTIQPFLAPQGQPTMQTFAQPMANPPQCTALVAAGVGIGNNAGGQLVVEDPSTFNALVTDAAARGGPITFNYIGHIGHQGNINTTTTTTITV
jgi:hypothetical protein